MKCKKCASKLKKFSKAKQYFSFLSINVLLCENDDCGVLHDTAGNIHYRRVKGVPGGYELSYRNDKISGNSKVNGGTLCKDV